MVYVREETFSSCSENALEQHPTAQPKHERKKKRFPWMLNMSSSVEPHYDHSGQHAGSSQKEVVVVHTVWKMS